MANLRDTGEHLVAHEILEREIVGLQKTVNRSMDVMADSIEEINANMRSLSENSAVTREKLNHLASDNDVSQAISICQATNHTVKPINWKGITAMITGIIIAATGGAVAIIKAFGL